MDNLFINKEKGIPEINFNVQTGIFEICGQSYPEDSIGFYVNVINWLKNFLSINKNPIVFNIKLTYFNTSSSKAILDMLDMLEVHFKNGIKIEVNWFYDKDDDDIYDHGLEFTEGLSYPCKIIPYSE